MYKIQKQQNLIFLKLKRGRLVEAYFDRSILKYITLHKIKVVARFYVTQYVEILAIFN